MTPLAYQKPNFYEMPKKVDFLGVQRGLLSYGPPYLVSMV